MFLKKGTSGERKWGGDGNGEKGLEEGETFTLFAMTLR